MAPPGRPPLDRESVAAAALELLDELGLDRLSLRRLAEVLGVRSPALYWHFRDKAELLDLMAQDLLRRPTEGPTPSDDPAGWRAWAAEHARERRRTLLSRRDGARLVVGSRPGPEIATRAEEDLRALVGVGFTPVEAFRTLVAVGHYVTGFVIEEQAAHERGVPTGPPGAAAATPLLRRAIADGGPPENDQAFEHGLHALLRGLGPASDSSG